MRALELKIPPPAVALLFAVAMWLMPHGLGTFGLPLSWRIVLGIALASIGQAISVSGMIAFRRARTTINPLKPSAASSLVQGDIYRFTRNPMYVGLLLSLAGWAVYLGHALPLLGLPVFAWYITTFQIKPEERILSAMFGAQFNAYAQKVRRWV
jgi:protein-S-isoprenylcysteine O-methyltransferase Ste14